MAFAAVANVEFGLYSIARSARVWLHGRSGERACADQQCGRNTYGYNGFVTGEPADPV